MISEESPHERPESSAKEPEENLTETQEQADEQPDPQAEEVAQLRSEIEEFKDKYMRAAADAENARRRADKERSDLLRYGLEGFFKDLLPVLDSFVKALPDVDTANEAKGDPVAFREGMVMVKKQLTDVLNRHGLESVPARGEPFNPNVHQAIQRVEAEAEGEVDEETVLEEFQKGYTLHGRLIRPSMVSVKVPTASKPAPT